jgi:hypothetical protein
MNHGVIPITGADRVGRKSAKRTGRPGGQGERRRPFSTEGCARKPTSFEEFATAAFAQYNQPKVSRFFSTTEEKVKTDE